MTQTQLSENVGISTRTLSKVENGFDIKLSLFLAISDALGADAAELLQLSGSRSALTEANVQEIELHLQAIKALLQK